MGLPTMREVQDGALVAIIRPFLGKDRTNRAISAGGRLVLSHSSTGEVMSQIKYGDELDGTHDTKLQVVVYEDADMREPEVDATARSADVFGTFFLTSGRGPEAVRPTWKTPRSGGIPRDFNLTADDDGLLGRPVLIMNQQGLPIGHGIIGRL
ncbi:hypothetical protein ABEF95_015924 [Exophiala dermatitidis]